MSKLNLPHLKPNNNVPNPKESGKWMSSHVNLETVADALPVDEEVLFTDDDEPVRAVPDPWAQATSFAEALRKSMRGKKEKQRSGLADRAVSQWRGLLGILALQHLHSTAFTLRPLSVDLSDDTHFAKVMTTLTPEVAIKDQAPLWREPTLIMLQEAHDTTGIWQRPLAMTNPVCLVSPGRDSHRLTVPNIQWAQGDLHDPLKPGSSPLSPRELSILHHFVSGLIVHIEKYSGEAASDIGALLRAFAGDIQNALNRPADSANEPRNAYEKGTPALFQPLWNDYKLTESTGGLGDHVSEALIKSPAAFLREDDDAEGEIQDAADAKVKGYIIVDPALGDAYGRDPSQILVWKQTYLSALLRSKAELEAAQADAARNGYIMITADDLMTSRAVRFVDDPLINGHPDELREMVLPIKPLSLLLTSEPRKAIEGKAIGDRAMITLRLRLDDGTPEGRALNLTRHYAANPVPDEEYLLVEDEEWELTNCQVWPDFACPSWHTYMARFIYRSSLEKKAALPRMGVSAALLREVISEAEDCSNAATALLNINAGKRIQLAHGASEAPPFRSKTRAMGEKNAYREELQFSNRAFQAVYYTEADGDNRPEAPVGLVLLDIKEKNAPTDVTKVGIDFGTTNSVVAFGEATAPPTTFAQRLLLPVRPANKTTFDNALDAMKRQLTQFFPPEARSTPISTVAIPKAEPGSSETLWAFRNLIYFYTAQPPAKGGERKEFLGFLNETRSAKFDLKWSTDPDIREAAKDFLTQLMVMTAAELIEEGYDPARSTWYFSVPEAYSPNTRNDFSNELQSASRAIGQSPETTDYPDLISEGLAAARYMIVETDFISDNLNIILDIGGGTTDVTIWSGTDPIWRGSFKIAGGNFFTMVLVQNSEILEAIGLKSWALSLDAFKEHEDRKKAEERRKYMAEMLFSGRSGNNKKADLERALEDHWGRISAKPGEDLRHASLAYMSGLAWYLGKVVRQLLEDGVFGEFDPEDPDNEALRLVSMPAFAVCGRGGGIFRLMHGARRGPDAETVVTQALGVFKKSVGLESMARPRFVASEYPKLEVVRGMLGIESKADEERLHAGAITGLSNIVPAGLEVSHADGKIQPADDFDAAKLPTQPRVADLKEFTEFLDAFEECSGIAIDLMQDSGKTEVAHNQIASDVIRELKDKKSELDRARKSQQDRVGVEPPFIIALRSLVDRMAKPREDREDTMEIWGAE